MMGHVTDLSDASDEGLPALDDDAETRPAGAVDATADTPADAPGDAMAVTPRRRRRRKFDKGLFFASLGIAIGLVLVIRGLSVGITGDERDPLPDLVEEVVPVPDAVQVLNQTRVFVDLATGYTGVLVIDGIEIPTVDIQDYATQEAGQQVSLPPVTIFEGGNNTLTFIPNDEAPVTEFTTGVHTATVIYWDIEIGRERARSFTWSFNVI